MRVAIINNGVSHPTRIISLLKDAEVKVFDFSQSKEVLSSKFDFIILTGSSQFPIIYNEEKLEDEVRLIQESSVPILGICYGCELIAFAFGGTLKDTQVRRQDLITIQTIKDDTIFEGKKIFTAYDAHRWTIESLPEEIEVLAISEHGAEIIRHTTRPIYGFQFHPEKMLEESSGDELFYSFRKKYLSAFDTE